MFGDLLRAYRKALKLTLDELAEKVGVSREHLGNLEHHRRGPSLDLLEKLVEALELTSPAELRRFTEAGIASRAEQDKDLSAAMAAYQEEIRLARKQKKRLVALILRLRDSLLKAKIELPQDLLDAIEAAAASAED